MKHYTHYEKSDWSRTWNKYTIACEIDMKTQSLKWILQ